MNNDQKIEQLESRLRRMEYAEQRRVRQRARAVNALVVVIALGSAVVGVRETLAWCGCSQTLPSPLTAFCAGDPASAAQINGNFKALSDGLVGVQQKVGSAAGANVTVAGTETVTGLLTAKTGLAVTGAATVSNGLTVAQGGAAVTGVLAVTGNSTVSGSSTVTGDLTTKGTLTAAKFLCCRPKI